MAKEDLDLNKDKQRISNISSVLSKIDRDIKSKDEVTSVVPKVNNVLDQMGSVLHSFSYGMARIASSTAKFPKEVISQYGQAIRSEISINKQNLIAMTLSRTTPILGYFASKFMETDIFKDASRRIKDELSGAISSVGVKARDIFSGVFGKIGSLFSSKTAKKSLSRKTVEEIPKAQKGGLVKKEGLARIHAAEIISPIGKLQESIDESKILNQIYEKTKKISLDLSDIKKNFLLSLIRKKEGLGGEKTIRDPREKAFSSSLKSIADITYRRSLHLEHYIIRREKKDPTAGVVKTFIKSYMDAAGVGHSLQEKSFRALLELKTSLIGATRLTKLAWQRTLYEHPTFRVLIAFAKSIKDMTFFIPKFLFRKRGGYGSDLPKSGNAYSNMVSILGLIYCGEMFRLDKIVEYSKRTSLAITDISKELTGKEYGKMKPVARESWSIAGKAWKGITKSGEWAAEKVLPENIAKTLTEKRTVSGEISKGWEGIKKAVKPKDMLVLEELEKRKAKEKKEAFSLIGLARDRNKLLRRILYVLSPEEKKKEREKFEKKEENITYLEEFKKRRSLSEKLKKPLMNETGSVIISPSFLENMSDKLENIKKRSRQSYEKVKEQFSLQKKMLKASERISSGISMLRSKIKSLGGRFITMILFGFSFIKSSFGKFFSFIRPLTSIFSKGISGVARMIVPFLGPIMGVIMAGAAGAAIGTLINKYLIDPIMNKWYKNLEKRSKKANEESLKILSEHSQKLREGLGSKSGAIGAKEAIKMRTGLIGETREMREKDYGILTSKLKMGLIQASQEKFMDKNINEYLKYGYVQVNALRSQWLKEGGFRGKNFAESAEEYGLKREESFLNYIKKKGAPISKEELEKEAGVKESQYSQISNMKELAKRKATEKLIEGKVVAEKFSEVAKETSQKMSEGISKAGKSIVASSNSMTMAANNIVNSNQTNNQIGNQGNRSFSSGDRFAASVLQCDMG